jgi:predicted MFS family arabinose efflux permease
MSQIAPDPSARRTEFAIFVLAALLAIISSGVNYVLPNYLLGIQANFGMRTDQLGFIPGGESLAIGIGCILTGLFLRRGHARAILAATAICLIGDLISLFAHDFVSIFAVRVIVGLAGEGPLYAISYLVIAAAANTDRALGIAVTSVALFGAAILTIEGPLVQAVGPAAVLVPFSIVAAGLLAWIAQDRSAVRVQLSPKEVAEEGGRRAGLDKGALAIILSIILISGVASASWAFVATAAEAVGTPPGDIAKAVSAGIVLGLAGSIFPAIFGNRFGRNFPIALCSISFIIACALLVSGSGFIRVAAASMVLQFCWGMTAIYQMSGLVARDVSRRYTPFGAVAQMAGMALAPPIFGYFIAGYGYRNLPLLVALWAVPGMLLFIWGSRSQAKQHIPALAL